MNATKPRPASSLGNVIPAQQIQFAKPHARHVAPVAETKPSEPQPEPARHEPQVTLIKEGGTVQAIEVICSCGEVIRLECKYVD